MSTIALPLPPSVNSLWRTGRGRMYRSRRYVAWLTEAGWELKAQRPKRFAGAVRIDVAIGRPDRRKRDLDNVATKAIQDLLTAHQIIEDDSLVTSLAARWDDTITPGTVHVTLTPAT